MKTSTDIASDIKVYLKIYSLDSSLNYYIAIEIRRKMASTFSMHIFESFTLIAPHKDFSYVRDAMQHGSKIYLKHEVVKNFIWD